MAYQSPHRDAERQRAGDLKVLQMIAAGEPLASVLDTLVRVIEERADGMVGSILTIEDGVRVRHAAAPNLPDAYKQAIDGQEIGPSHGSCGTAAYRRETVIVEDIATDPLWDRYRELALTCGLGACWSMPVLAADGSVLATFALYYPKRRRPTPELLALTTHATHLAAIALERNRHEQALVSSEARARLIIENALDANIIMNSDGIVTEWSGRATELFGWSPADAIGKKLSELIIPENMRAEHEQALRGYGSAEASELFRRRIEVSAPHRDGHAIPVELSITPIELPGKRIFSAFISDIAARKRAEQALRESEQHLSLVYEHIVDVLFHIQVEADGDYRFVSLNPAFYRATGLEPGKVSGRLVRDVIPEPSLSLVMQKYDEAVRTRRTVRWDETTVFPAGNRHGEVAVTPVFDAEGRPKYLIGSVRDVTDRKRLEAEMRQLQKMEAIGRLSGGIAHDFNNILGVILMRAQMVLEDLADPDQRDQLQEILLAGERGASLTKQFLAFSRKQVLRPDVISLNASVENVEKMLRPLLGANVDFVAALAPDLWRVEADPGQIEQVIMNLVINAKDAMPDGGKLTIETANIELDAEAASAHLEVDTGSYVMLAVTDTGTGMSEETQKRIFEPFFTTKEPGKGTGLGLATVYGIVKQSLGYIWVYSELGQGTSFKVYLRRTTADAMPKAEPPKRRKSGQHVLGHVLVVEDEPALRDTLARLLRQLRCSVTVAANAQEALAAVSAESAAPDILFTDMMMPGMSGALLVERLRETYPQLKAVFMSGYPDGAIAHQAALQVGSTFLQKPFTINDLAAILSETFDSPASA